jgi:hypothetical protein
MIELIVTEIRADKPLIIIGGYICGISGTNIDK